MKQYGYCRISTAQQSIERQVRNIKAAYSAAIIVQEVYSGTQFQGRKELEKILRQVKAGDAIIFDSVSRMSRDALEGFEVYQELFNRGVRLIFLKEPHIDTEIYRKAIQSSIAMTGTNVDFILQGINQYLLALAKEQIVIAFAQAEKEVQDLRQRTREGIETARLNGKQIGQRTGAKLKVKKAIRAKEEIIKYSKDFDGQLDDPDVIRLVGVARNTYYRYKKQLRQECG